MVKAMRKRSTKAGLPPGTLIYVGERKIEAARITIIDYDEADFLEKQVAATEECFHFKATPTVTWINIDGLHQVDIIEKLGGQFELHPLVLEDILHAGQRPKLEDFDNYIYIVLKMLSYSEPKQKVEAEQVSLVLGPNFVITFQERPGDCLDPVRKRLRQAKGRVRSAGADYLAYALLDAVVDAYFPAMEQYGEWLDTLDAEISAQPGPDVVVRVHQMRNDLLMLRRAIWPFRDDIGGLVREPNPLV